MGGEAMGGEEDEKEEEGVWQRHGLGEERRGEREGVCVTEAVPGSVYQLVYIAKCGHGERRRARGEGRASTG